MQFPVCNGREGWRNANFLSAVPVCPVAPEDGTGARDTESYTLVTRKPRYPEQMERGVFCSYGTQGNSTFLDRF